MYQDAASGIYHVNFRFGKARFHRSLETDDERKANSMVTDIEETVHDLKRGRLTMPPNADPWEFIKSGGKREQQVKVAKKMTLDELFTLYQEKLPSGSMEENSKVTMRIHVAHLLRILGKTRVVEGLAGSDVQDYVNKRAREKFRGNPIQADTIKKEVATLRAIWNWAVEQGRLSGRAPTKGLKYDKRKSKLPFQTWAEIERKVGRGGLSTRERKELWASLFLDEVQVSEVLEHVKENATRPFVYPMFVFVAHTGARRSEMARSRVDDIDLERGLVRIREKKRDRSVEMTFRNVKMSPLLLETMKEWLSKNHPGGQYTFCQEANTRLTENEATHYFKSTLEDSKWKVVKGFHVFRHSFASNLARKGVDPRVIDKFMGHQTEEMRKRYSHMFPEQEELAIKKLFG